MTNSSASAERSPIHPWLSAYLLFTICYLSIQRMRDVDESLPVGKWAYGLMLAFLICLLGVSWAVAVDWQSRHELEQISQPTAVGDPIAVGFDATRDQAKEVVRWKGHSPNTTLSKLAWMTPARSRFIKPGIQLRNTKSSLKSEQTSS
jgi:hypothetical protein